MSDINDPTITQPTCSECGLNIRSENFQLKETTHRFEQGSPGKQENRYVHGIPSPMNVNVGQWRHDDPRVTDHPFKGHRASPMEKTSHDADYERQERLWRMKQLEDRSHLGPQF